MAGQPVPVRGTALGAMLLLAGCAADPQCQTIEVLVPVRADPPADLATAPVFKQLPRFITPSDPAAKAALSETDLNLLKTLLRTLVTRDEAWRAWASTPPETLLDE